MLQNIYVKKLVYDIDGVVYVRYGVFLNGLIVTSFKEFYRACHVASNLCFAMTLKIVDSDKLRYMNRVFSSTHRTFRNAMRFFDYLVSDIPVKDFFKDKYEFDESRYDFLNLLWQIRRSKVVLKSQIVIDK